ncbi:hypothetical protein ACL02O_30860 [Micromonospora sp. MS34]|uniref:hypothetical protein n=1 Tax=Micromonospora sp. MS34 TaxID=3385971 RepID=UPI0039A1DEAF
MPLIYPKDREDAQNLAKQLLDAAGAERHDDVRTTTDGPLGIAFDVPDDLAQKALGSGDGRQLVETQSTSADAGADGSGADGSSTDGSSQPSTKASRSSRTSRSS